MKTITFPAPGNKKLLHSCLAFFMCAFQGSATNATEESKLSDGGVIPSTSLKCESQDIAFKNYPTIALPSLSPSQFRSKPIVERHVELQGFVTFSEHGPNPSETIQHLVAVAIERNKERDLLNERSKFHSKKWTRVVSRSKSMLQYATSYQGFESSSEAADVILEEKLKLKSGSAVEFVRQRQKDAAHLQLVCAVMEIATGLGLADTEKRELAVQSGMQAMIPLVGEEEAQKCLHSLTAWSKQVKIAEDAFAREHWDVLRLRQKSQEVLANSLAEDDVVKSIETRLHKFNHHSNFSRVTSKFVNTTLSIIAFSPTMASPAAQAAQFVYVACTGGPEEKKLLKEVYLDRCFESRFDRLSQESMLVMNSYNDAVLTHNPILFSFTQAMIDGMTNPAVGAALTSNSIPLPNQETNTKVFGQRI
jgi:hypothetical protein